MKTLFLFLSSFALPVLAQTYTVITSAKQTITINLPAGAIWQIGNTADNKWSADQSNSFGVSFTAWYGELANYNYLAKFADPDPTKPEVFRIKQTAVQQTIYLTDRSVTPSKNIPVVIPALDVVAPPPPPPPPPTPAPFLGRYTCVVNFASDWTFSVDPKTCIAVSK